MILSVKLHQINVKREEEKTNNRVLPNKLQVNGTNCIMNVFININLSVVDDFERSPHLYINILIHFRQLIYHKNSIFLFFSLLFFLVCLVKINSTYKKKSVSCIRQNANYFCLARYIWSKLFQIHH